MYIPTVEKNKACVNIEICINQHINVYICMCICLYTVYTAFIFEGDVCYSNCILYIVD